MDRRSTRQSSSLSSHLTNAQALVDKRRYHDANQLVENVVEAASIHPEISDEEFDTVSSQHTAFEQEVESRYTDDDVLSEHLDTIEQVLP